MKRVAVRLTCVALLAAGCAPRAPQADAEAARLFAENSSLAAVAKPGARVCRRMQTGISEVDIIRGVVVEARAPRIAVRVETAGRLPHAIGAVALVPKAVVWDDAAAWTPCL
ncbi:MAG: hypothetical protein ACT4P4_23675 [Betaproteobacteria bacterium]